MSTCRCCGQHLEANLAPAGESVAGIRVNTTVEALCNDAYAQAERRGHAQVEIAHLVIALEARREGAVALAQHGLSAVAILEGAEQWLHAWASMADRHAAPRTAQDVKLLLMRAQARAQSAGRTHASVEDIAEALAGDMTDVWSATFLAEARRTDVSAALHSARAPELPPVVREIAQTHMPAQANTSAEAEAPSLLDREYAWVRAHLRDQRASSSSHNVSERAPQASAARVALSSYSSSSVLSSAATAPASASAAFPRSRAGDELLLTGDVSKGETRRGEDGQRETGRAETRGGASAGGGASAREATGQAAAATMDGAALRSVIERLDAYQRHVSQRLDLQQQMLTDLAETFARSMREAARFWQRPAATSNTSHEVEAHASRVRARLGEASAHADRRGQERTSDRVQEQAAPSPEGSGRERSQGTRRARTRRRALSSFHRRAWTPSAQGRRAERADGEVFTRGNGSASVASQLVPNGIDLHRNSEWAERAQRDRPGLSAGLATLSPAADEGERNESAAHEKRFYLTLDDDVEKAPSIGPRTAGQLTAAGVKTVRDLLRCSPADVASRVQVRYITAERIAQWQAQARLVCTVPWLRGTHAQLLAGAGYDTIEKIAAADAATVCTAILKFAATRDGQSVLRAAQPPGESWVALRLEHARAAEPWRAVA